MDSLFLHFRFDGCHVLDYTSALLVPMSSMGRSATHSLQALGNVQETTSMIISIDPSLIVNVALGIYGSIWLWKGTKALLDWVIEAQIRAKRRQT